MNKYQVAVLHAFRELCSAAQFCDLAVKCLDREVMVPGILLAALNPVLSRYIMAIVIELSLSTTGNKNGLVVDHLEMS